MSAPRFPDIFRCPTPGHDHTVYREHPTPAACYRVAAWVDWRDVELSRPRALTYHATRAGARNAYAGWQDAPGIVAELVDIRAGRVLSTIAPPWTEQEA